MPLRLDYKEWCAAPKDLQMRILARALTFVGGGDYRPRFAALENLVMALTAPAFCTSTLNNCIVSQKGDAIIITPEQPRVAPRPSPHMHSLLIQPFITAPPLWEKDKDHTGKGE
jgi:hypothetical protein